MFLQLPIALLAIVFGALETAGGMQELVYRGILKSLTQPLEVGTLGTVAGVLLLAAGIALLVRAPLAPTLVRATAYVSVPTFILIGIILRYSGWRVTAIGILFPLFLMLFSRKNATA
jgi:hypothetical protein